MKTGEYVIRLSGYSNTPQPWINVISNPGFGFHVSAEGAGFTWSGNSRDYQLTQWSNDPVINRSGEALYVVDLDKNTAFAPTASVLRDPSVQYETRHGQGYSTFVSRHGNVGLELTHTIDPKLPVRVSRLKITNHGGSAKACASTASWSGCWVMPVRRHHRSSYLHPIRKPALSLPGTRMASTGARMWRSSPRNLKPQSDTADRIEFFGALGTVDRPAAVLQAKSLSNLVEAGGDPCAALAVDIELGAGETKEVLFYMGDAGNADEARRISQNTTSARSRKRCRRQRRSGPVSSMDCRSIPPTMHSMSWSIGGCLIRAWRAGSGRARPSIRQVAPLDSGISCRIRCPC